jgi:FMN phosphatase YigB (HAD superfamily)
MIKTILLDLDNTLIETQSYFINQKQKEQESFILDGRKYFVYFRPYLKELFQFLFSNFKIGIYTSATKSYAINIISSFYNNDFISLEQKEKLIKTLLHRKDLKGKDEIKDLYFASKYHNVEFNEILLIDDNPYYPHKSQILNKKVYWDKDEINDKFILTLIRFLKIKYKSNE